MRKKFLFFFTLLHSYTLTLTPTLAADPATLSDLDSVFSSILNVALAGVGLGVVVMFVIGGYQFMMAGGDKEAAARAKLTLTYAVIGLIVALSAWIILSLLGNFLGVDFTIFNICWGPGC